MENKLYLSDELLKAKGYAYFIDMEYDDFKWLADNEPVTLEDGVMLLRDDMYNLYLSLNEDDESFENIEDLRNKIALDYYSKSFNMKDICEKANVNYTTYRAWKQKGLNPYKIIALLEEMKKLSSKIEFEYSGIKYEVELVVINDDNGVIDSNGWSNETKIFDTLNEAFDEAEKELIRHARDGYTHVLVNELNYEKNEIIESKEIKAFEFE